MNPLISDADLAMFREMAEANMRDVCVITRGAPAKGEFDPETGRYATIAAEVVYGPEIAPHFGKCRLQIQSVTNVPSDQDAGDRKSETQGGQLQLPVSDTGHIAVKDVAKMLVVHADPELLDHEYTVTGRHGKSQATARRLPVVEVTA